MGEVLSGARIERANTALGGKRKVLYRSKISDIGHSLIAQCNQNCKHKHYIKTLNVEYCQKMLENSPYSLPDQGSTNKDALWVCSSCIGDQFLKKNIQENEPHHECSFCGTLNPALTVDALADQSFSPFMDYVKADTSSSDDQSGVSLDMAVSKMLQSSQSVADAVLQIMKQKHRQDHIEQCGWDIFDPNYLYHFGISFFNLQETRWNSACQSLKGESRFFNAEIKKLLASIFENLPQTAIRFFGGDNETRLYRARVANSEAHACEMLKHPAEQFGPPPLGNIFGGRMNPVGIPVLYTALEPETACAEVRPHLGATVVIASLAPLRNLKLLDLTSLGDYEIDVSPFDPDVGDKLDRQFFLQYFSKLLARPVNPQSESIDYLPTQCVADYLANSPTLKLDGFICYSAMKKGGKNIVLFQHALTIKIDDDHLATSKVEFEEPWKEDDIGNYVVYRGISAKKQELYRDPALELKSRDTNIINISEIYYSSLSSKPRWKDVSEA